MSKEQILGVVRHLVTFAGGYLVANNPDLTDLDPASLAGAVVTVLGVIWSVLAPEKKKDSDA